MLPPRTAQISATGCRRTKPPSFVCERFHLDLDALWRRCNSKRLSILHQHQDGMQKPAGAQFPDPEERPVGVQEPHPAERPWLVAAPLGGAERGAMAGSAGTCR